MRMFHFIRFHIKVQQVQNHCLLSSININPISSIFKQMFLYYKCYIRIKLTFLKELMLIKQVHQKSVMFVTIGIF